MSAAEIGARLVALANQGREGENQAVSELYADNIVSIEGAEGGEVSARIEGIDNVRGKHDWWYGANDVHSSVAEGPYVGLKADQFAVRFTIDMTPPDSERTSFVEMGLFTVADGKIVQEEFLYLMG